MNKDIDRIIEMIDERMKNLKEKLREIRGMGVDTPGFNQVLGAFDELTFLRDDITNVDEGEDE